MNLLAVDTTDKIASVALMMEGTVVAKRSADAIRRHAETVAPLVEELLSDFGLTAQEIDFFAADVGPGSFTGVRIGVCLVNALALAANKPVIAVDSLLALATGAADLSKHICALIDAGNGNVYAAQYEDNMCVMPPEAVAMQDYLPRIRQGALVVGSGAITYCERIRNGVPHAQLAPEAYVMPHAEAVLLAASGRIGTADRMVKPLYLRPSQAERMLQQRMEAQGR